LKRPTRADVAKLAGVSVATVSYVVNDGPRPVAEETRKRVLAAINELGYRPHAIARSLKTGSTQTVALLAQNLVQSFIGYLVNAVEENLARHNYGLILASSQEDPEREKRMLNVLASQSIDGLLYIPVSNHDGDYVSALIEEGIPVVFLDRYIPGVPADVVMTDNIAAAKTITNHLLEQGCQHIICLSFSDEASSALDRVEGYQQALRERGLPVTESRTLVTPYMTDWAIDQVLTEYMNDQGLPDGILCTTDDFVVRTIKVLKKRGIRIPEQVKVAGGFVQCPWNELLESPVPIVHQNFEAMARQAVEFLVDRLEGDDSPPRTALIEAEFILEPTKGGD